MKATDWLPYVHRPTTCLGEHCAFHNPSDHHMADWHIAVRMDRQDLLTERICDHGVGHPDPDNLSFLDTVFGRRYAEAAGVHGCDGCCRE